MALDLALVAGIVAAVWQFRQDWWNARLREQGVVHHRVTAPPPVSISRPSLEPVLATSYAEIAQKMLFSKDRNPEVIVEVAAPPPKPMPPLPLLYGVMNLLDGTTVIMSEKSGATHQGVRPGGKVGPFTLVAVNNQEITLEWEGKTVTKDIHEMIDRSSSQAPPAPGTPRATTPPPSTPVSQPVKAEAAPGKDVGNRLHACQPGDTSPPGTVSGGYRKVVTPSPFGDMCRWEPI
jgi:hypothetical protein